MNKYKKINFALLILLMLFLSGCSYNEVNKNQHNNPYFFKQGQTSVQYEGYFLPLSTNEIKQEVVLNISEIENFDDGKLFTLELEQLEVTDPLDEIAMGRRYLGYFLVTDNIIYFLPRQSNEGYLKEDNEIIIELIKKDWEGFLNKSVIVCSDNGTVDISDEDGWHSYVEVDGSKRVYHLYNDYVSGTKEYEEIVWEKDKGITYYKHGSGSMLMHIEFGENLYE